MKKVLIIGASGLLGSSIANELETDAIVVRASLRDSRLPVDITNEESIKTLFKHVGPVDSIISTAGVANFVKWEKATSTDWKFSFANKFQGQIDLIRFGRAYVKPGGAIVLTTGILAQNPIPGSSIISAVNAGLEAAIRALSIELDGSVRIGAISPGWVTETLVALDMPSNMGMPAKDIAKKYLEFIQNGCHGEIVTVG